MSKIKSICIITANYPTDNEPVYTFVDQLVCQFADNGINCIVISPTSITKRILRNGSKVPREIIRETKKGNKIRIFRPKFLSFSHSVLNINTSMISFLSFRKCVFKEIKKHNILPDVFYGHFIVPSGMCATDLGQVFGIPSFIAYGESSTINIKKFKKSFIFDKLSGSRGVISVSSENKRELLDLKLVLDSDKIKVFPNGIDNSKFYKIDKVVARKALGIPEKVFIVAFLGSFIERKGVKVLSSALDSIEEVYSIFIGKGPCEPKCKNILFKGTVTNDKVFMYLNAADIFVLPTLAEGCCNAIIEAMACGLPIISSNQSFNDDILNSENSIRIDVEDEEVIRNAILILKNNKELRKNMSNASQKKASLLSISQRAKNIVKFMEYKIDK